MPITTDTLELELIERSVVEIVAAGINDQIDAQNDLWLPRDAEFYATMGRTVPTDSAIEHVELDHIYSGSVSALIDAPPELYPNIAIMCYRGIANPNAGGDWTERYAVTLAIELMVKAIGNSDKPDTAADAAIAEVANSRCKRTVTALQHCLKSDKARTLGGNVPRIGGTPTVMVTDVFVRREERGHGPRWFWCGARLEYSIDQWVNY